MFRFHSPEYLWLLLLVPLLFWLARRQKRSVIQFSSLSEVKKAKAGQSATFLLWMLRVMRTIGFILLVLALARPQDVEAEREYETKGIDIVLSMDISGSMLAEDFKPVNRMAVAKQEAIKFVRGRENDRMGLVVFAAKSYTQCPMTMDYDILIKLIEEIEIGMIKDGTAIGLGLANAVNRLRDSEAKSKIIILITDGANNAGNIDPVTAAELAKSFGIKVYTIGIGRGGLVPFPVEDPIFGKRYVQAQVDIDFDILKRIADITGGQFFPAADPKALADVYKQIDRLEKTDIKVKEYTNFKERYPVFLIPGFLVLMLEVLAGKILFFKIP